MRCAVAGRCCSSSSPIGGSVSICFGGDGAVAGRPFPGTTLPPFTVVALLPGGVLPDGGTAPWKSTEGSFRNAGRWWWSDLPFLWHLFSYHLEFQLHCQLCHRLQFRASSSPPLLLWLWWAVMHSALRLRLHLSPVWTLQVSLLPHHRLWLFWQRSEAVVEQLRVADVAHLAHSIRSLFQRIPWSRRAASFSLPSQTDRTLPWSTWVRPDQWHVEERASHPNTSTAFPDIRKHCLGHLDRPRPCSKPIAPSLYYCPPFLSAYFDQGRKIQLEDFLGQCGLCSHGEALGEKLVCRLSNDRCLVGQDDNGSLCHLFEIRLNKR